MKRRLKMQNRVLIILIIILLINNSYSWNDKYTHQCLTINALRYLKEKLPRLKIEFAESDDEELKYNRLKTTEFISYVNQWNVVFGNGYRDFRNKDKYLLEIYNSSGYKGKLYYWQLMRYGAFAEDSASGNGIVDISPFSRWSALLKKISLIFYLQDPRKYNSKGTLHFYPKLTDPTIPFTEAGIGEYSSLDWIVRDDIEDSNFGKNKFNLTK
jgi:hypothetical protein